MHETLVRLTCPLCGEVERMQLGSPLRYWRDAARDKPSTDASGCYVVACAALCPNCQRPFGVLLSRIGDQGSPQSLWQQGSANAIDAVVAYLNVETVPNNPEGVRRFAHVPDLIAQNFHFVQEDAARRRNPAGVMGQCRSCLDVALKVLGQTEGGRRQRIQNLADQGVITKAIAAWAQNLWEEGSDASHDLTAEMGRALEHVEFLRLFFEVAFELPAQIAANPHAPPDVSTY